MHSYGQVILILLSSLHAGHTMHCACTENLKRCSSIHQIPADYKSAQDYCRQIGSKIITLQSAQSNETVSELLDKANGNFWIGSSNMIDVARSSQSIYTREGKKTAWPPLCLMVSNKGKRTEGPCDRIINGFICDSVPFDMCSLDKSSNITFLNKDACLMHKCEHHCSSTRYGYTCSCGATFTQSRKNPLRCAYFCKTVPCSAFCYNKQCDCPEGFVLSGNLCEDINECFANHNCAQNCLNTVGSYTCSCGEDFILMNRTQCVPRGGLLSPGGILKEPISPTPSLNYTSKRPSLATAGEYVGVTFFIVVVIFAVMVLVRYLKKRKTNERIVDCDVLDDAEQRI